MTNPSANVVSSNKQLLLFILSAVVLFAGIGLSPIYILDEARNAQCAREMMLRNDWIVPTFNGELRGQKPPLHYYFMRLAYTMFGVNEFAARFFSAVSGIATILITWVAARKFLSDSAAFLTTIFLVSSLHFLFEFGLAVPDPYLIFFITALLLSVFAYAQTQKWKWILLAAVAASFAVLTKGPVAVALPGLIILLWLFWEKKLNLLLSFKTVAAALLFIALTTPWFWLVHQATNGQFTNEFFITHNINRFNEPMEGHGGLFIIVPLFVLLGMLPGSAFIATLFHKKKIQTAPSIIKLSLVTVLVFVVFFSISKTKLPNYPMPCYPFLALLLAHGLTDLYNSGKRVKSYIYPVLLAIAILLIIAAYIALRIEPGLKGMEYLAFFFVPLPVLLTAAHYMNRKYSFAASLNYLLLGYFMFNLMFMVVVYPAVYRQNPVAKTIQYIAPLDKVYAYDIYNPGFNFYINKNVTVLKNEDSIYTILKEQPAARIITRKNLYETLDTSKLRVYAAHRDLFELPETVIFGAK